MDKEALLQALIERGGWLNQVIKNAETDLLTVKDEIRAMCKLGTEEKSDNYILKVVPNRRWSPEKARDVIHPDLLPIVSELTPLKDKCESMLSEDNFKKCFNTFPNVVRIQPKDK